MKIDDIQNKLKDLIDNCPQDGMVFFGGAGVSTESGIPDFRSAGGIFMKDLGGQAVKDAKRRGNSAQAERIEQLKFTPAQVVSRTFFNNFPSEFYSFYCNNMIYPQAQPNACHKKLAQLEDEGKLKAIVTQNIDGLHQMAGSKKVYELHGSVLRNYCMDCREFYKLEDLLAAQSTATDGVPRCSCGGIIKPDVVLYEEGLDQNVIEGAINAIRTAHLLIVAGTSLVVNPAASLIRYFQGDCLVIVNLSSTYADSSADLVLTSEVGKAFDW